MLLDNAQVESVYLLQILSVHTAHSAAIVLPIYAQQISVHLLVLLSKLLLIRMDAIVIRELIVFQQVAAQVTFASLHQTLWDLIAHLTQIVIQTYA